MEKDEVIRQAVAQVNALAEGAGVWAMGAVAERTTLVGGGMLRALLCHELVSNHSLMMQLSAKANQFLGRLTADGAPDACERDCRQTIQLAAAVARLAERYRLGLMSLARLQARDAARHEKEEAAERRRDRDLDNVIRMGSRALEDALADDPDDPGLDDLDPDDPDGGGRPSSRRDGEALLAEAAALGLHTPRRPTPPADTTPTPTPAARGRLRHGNPSGDYARAPRCGARTRAGHACGQPGMKNGRCRLHGGRSTGARTAAGLARCRKARLVHGERTAEIIQLKAEAARRSRNLRILAGVARLLAQPQSKRPAPCQASRGAGLSVVAGPPRQALDSSDPPHAKRAHAPAPRRGSAGAPDWARPKWGQTRCAPDPAAVAAAAHEGLRRHSYNASGSRSSLPLPSVCARQRKPRAA